MKLEFTTYLIVCPLVFLAGFIDSIAGGGGLISLPAYLLAGLPAHLASGTNKMSAVFGTALATGKYAREGRIRWKAALPAAAAALPGAWLGAQLQLLIPERAVQAFMLVAIPVVALTILLRRNAMEQPRAGREAKVWLCALIGLVIGAYDGFFGPGTGTFLMLAFTFFGGMDLVTAGGSAKLVNLASNLAAMASFASSASALPALALPAALCSMAGNYLGSRLAVRKGARIIRPMFFVVLALLMGTVAYRFFA